MRCGVNGSLTAGVALPCAYLPPITRYLHVHLTQIFFPGVRKQMFRFPMSWGALCSCTPAMFNSGSMLQAGSSESTATAVQLVFCYNVAFDSTPTVRFCGKNTSGSKCCIVSNFNSGAKFYPQTARQKERAAVASMLPRLQVQTTPTFRSKSTGLLRLFFKAPSPKPF